VGRDIMPSYELEPQIVLTTPLLEGTDGIEKMSKSLGNYIGVTEEPAAMFAKVLSISDELMWKYWLMLTDRRADEIEADKQGGRPMESKLALARAIVADFHGAEAAAGAEDEWRRVHQQRQAPTEVATHGVSAGEARWRDLLRQAGLAASNSEAERLLRQKAVRRDGVVVDGAQPVRLSAGEAFVVSVGPARFLRVVVS